MKRKFIALAFAATILFVLAFYMPQPFVRVAMRFPDEAYVTIFCGSFCSDQKKSVCAAVMTSPLGSGFAVSCHVSDLPQIFPLCGEVDGISIKFNGDATIFDKVLSGFRLRTLKRQNFDGLTVVCGNSSLVKGGIMVDGACVNVQIAFDGKTVTVGSPLILGEY